MASFVSTTKIIACALFLITFLPTLLATIIFENGVNTTGTIHCQAAAGVNLESIYITWTFFNNPQALATKTYKPGFVTPCKTRFCIDNAEILNGVCDLIVYNLTRNDSGLYTCRLTEDSGLVLQESSTEVIVADRPGMPVVTIPQGMIEGNNVNITCSTAVGYPVPEITWHKDGQEVTGGVTNSSTATNAMSSLRLSLSYMDNGGNITCTARNILSSNSSVPTLLNITFAPRDTAIVPYGVALRVLENRSFNLTCTSKGNPAPTLIWSNAGNSAISASVVQTLLSPSVSVAQLVFNSIMRHDTSVYTCTASNTQNVTNASTTVSVLHSPAKPAIGAKGLIFYSGDNLTLNCTSTDEGNPRGSYNWTKDGDIIGSSGNLASFTLASVQLSSSGSYKCVMFNYLGSAFSDFLNISIYVKPSILMKTLVVAAVSGAPATLTCSAQGNPAPLFTWSRVLPNTSLSPGWQATSVSDSMPFVSKNELHSANISILDYGYYACNASNQVGSDAAQLHLKEPSLPEPPTNLAAAVFWTYVILNWESNDSGMPLIFTVYKTSMQLNTAGPARYDCGNQTICNVSGLAQGKTYTFLVVATNLVGLSNSSDPVTVTTLTVPFSSDVVHFVSGLSVTFNASSSYCGVAECTNNSFDTSTSLLVPSCSPLNGYTQLTWTQSCSSLRARLCVAQQPYVCGPYLTFTPPKVGDMQGQQSTPLSITNIIIIVCVVGGSAILVTIVVATVVCYRRREGKKSKSTLATSNTQLYHTSSNLTPQHSRVSGGEAPYATFMRDQVYANPNFDLDEDRDSEINNDFESSPSEKSPTRLDYVYASVGAKRRKDTKANGTSSYDMQNQLNSDFDEADGAPHHIGGGGGGDDLSVLSEPPPYPPQMSMSDSDAHSAADSKQFKKVIYEVIV